MERRQYKNPPISEAVCEFRFIQEPEWDPTIPGRLYAEIKGEYSGKAREKSFMHFESSEARHEIRLIYSTEEGNGLVVVGRNLLSVNALQPYEGWPSFRQRINKALDAYLQVAQPRGVERIGIRYINRLLIPEESRSFSKYSKGVPSMVADLPQNMVEFVSRVKYLYEDEIELRLTHSTAEADQTNELSFLLDLDLVWVASENGPRAIEDIMSIVDDLRERERSAFESLITNEARALFNGGSATAK